MFDTRLFSKSQNDCYREIVAEIEKGENRVTVLMPAGTGKTTMALTLCDKYANEKKILFICAYKVSVNYVSAYANDNGYHKMSVVMPHEISVELINQYDLIIIDCLDSGARDLIEEVCKHYNGAIVSFGDPVQEIFNPNSPSIPADTYGLFKTRRIVDIRDGFIADKEEREFIFSNFNVSYEILDSKREQTIGVIETYKQDQSAMSKRLSVYAEKLMALKDKAEKDNIKIEAEKEIQKIEDEKRSLQDELARKTAELEELQKQYEDQLAKMQMQAMLLGAFGLSDEEIDELINQIRAYKTEIEERINSDDVEIQELAYTQLQDKVVVLVSEKISSFIGFSQKKYEKKVRKCVTDFVWEERLSQKSREFLVSAEASYDVLSKNSEGYDFSGVCLLVTKALEVEVTRRFFERYIDYLRNDKGLLVSQWPEATRVKRGYQCMDEVISIEHFMLGTVTSFMGYKGTFDRRQNKIVYRINDQNAYDLFLDFACDKLITNKPRTEVARIMFDDLLFVEKVRTDYRNPAAHKNSLTKTSAEQCLNYVVEVDKMIKEMLSIMAE